MSGPQAARLSGGRLHLQHGPIDLILTAEGEPEAVAAAEHRALARFDGLLEELVAELPALRSDTPGHLRGAVARAMAAAVAPHRPAFVTPMAAVAGAVADAICAAMTAGGDLARACVNNGGDIAFHLAPGRHLNVAIATPGGFGDRIAIAHADPVRGIATSGWRGRSHSLGIADSVTVLAKGAAQADAAATLISNAVDLPGHPAVTRRPARALQADSDLRDRLVTVAVGALTPHDIDRALAAGARAAETMLARGLITGAALHLGGAVVIVGRLAWAMPVPAIAAAR